jgi:tetratricopeptide (TPR) repeat protein
MRRWFAVFALLVIASISAAAQTAVPDATARAARLDALFAELQSTKDQTRGQAATAEIWQLWMRSDQPEVDALTSEAVDAMASGQLPAARAVLDKVVVQAPTYAEGWNKRATVLYMLGEHAQSLADIDRVLALEPRHFGALAGQGLIHIAAQRWKEALASMRRAVAVNPFLAERDSLIPALERKVEGVPL